jgi:hypothetical protein
MDQEDKYREKISHTDVERYMEQRKIPSAGPEKPEAVAPAPVGDGNTAALRNEPLQQAEIPGQETEAPAEEQPQNMPISPLRTYKDDVARTISRKKTSLTSMVIAESRRKMRQAQSEKNEERRGIKNYLLFTMSILLIMGGIGSASYFYIKNQRENTALPIARISSLVFADAQEEFDTTGLTGGQLMSLLSAERDNAGSLPLGTIKHLYLTANLDGSKFLVGARDFLETIGADVRSPYLRSINQTFMLGFHVFNGSQPFLILKVGFFEGAFAGMLAWEGEMQDDLAPLFGQKADSIFDEDITKGQPAFSDVVIKNKDTRVLKDSAGNIILLYSFVDRETLVITTREDTFIEIFTRMTSSRVSK